ncbi:MAG TPA: exopolysaccharide biosynthesis protein [Stellaceae bacterium]|nr:exopolysaccharide biosynthesis protein [Stellaceae bacterium]
MPTHSRARTSALLRELAEGAGERISLGEVGAALEDRAFGILVLCLALPNAVPGPYIPGFSAILALPIMWLGLQLALGRSQPRLPGFLRRRSFARARFLRFVNRATPLLLRIEAWLGPHPGWLTETRGHRFLGLVLVIFGFGLSLPVPLGNLPVAIGISILALGLIEEDSRALRWGLLSGLLGCLWLLALVTFGVAVVTRIAPYFG